MTKLTLSIRRQNYKHKADTQCIWILEEGAVKSIITCFCFEVYATTYGIFPEVTKYVNQLKHISIMISKFHLVNETEYFFDLPFSFQTYIITKQL